MPSKLKLIKLERGEIKLLCLSFAFIFIFFTLNLLGFYVLMRLILPDDAGFLCLCYSFYVGVSVFNLFIISSAWSLLADAFSKDTSKKCFGIISGLWGV